jgi:hypothetical protein
MGFNGAIGTSHFNNGGVAIKKGLLGASKKCNSTRLPKKEWQLVVEISE